MIKEKNHSPDITVQLDGLTVHMATLSVRSRIMSDFGKKPYTSKIAIDTPEQKLMSEISLVSGRLVLAQKL